MMQTSLQFEPDLSRGRRNRQSTNAHNRLLPRKKSMREECYWRIACNGVIGMTLEGLCAGLGKQPHQLSGRITELKAAGRIFDSGKVRNGHTVYLADRFKRDRC